MSNNPLRYNDPTGHMEENEDDGGLTVAGFIYVIEQRFDWQLEDEFSLEEVKTIYQTGHDIETYADGLTDGMGLDWMSDYLGNINITHGENLGEYSVTLPTLQGTTISLGQGWLNPGGWDSKQLLAHELGHVWDIRSWLSNSSRLHTNLGGLSGLCFFCLPDNNIPRWDPRVNTYEGDAYANSGINDYFAEAFSWTIYNGATPMGVSSLINTYISEYTLYRRDW